MRYKKLFMVLVAGLVSSSWSFGNVPMHKKDLSQLRLSDPQLQYGLKSSRNPADCPFQSHGKLNEGQLVKNDRGRLIAVPASGLIVQ